MLEPKYLIEGVSQMHIDTDLLLLGGGSAGCMAAIAARAHSPTVAVTILEKGGALSRSEGGFC